MGLIFVGGDGSFQVFWWTDLEVDLERTQNCCMELWALYLHQMINSMMQLACMGAARQCPHTGPQGKYQLVASLLSTLVLLLTGGDGSFTALQKIIDLERKHLNLDLLLCFYFKKLCILKNVM